MRDGSSEQAIVRDKMVHLLASSCLNPVCCQIHTNLPLNQDPLSHLAPQDKSWSEVGWGYLDLKLLENLIFKLLCFL